MDTLVTLFFIFFLSSAEESLYSGKLQKIQDFGQFDLSELNGKNSLWYFYQPNCESCKTQSSDFTCLPKDLKILAIAVLGSIEASKKEFRKHTPRGLPLYGGTEWQKKLNVTQTPTLIALDTQGHIIQRWQTKTDCKYLRAALSL